MSAWLSPDLQERLERIAQRQQTSVEALLTEYVEREEAESFPGDPYHFLDLSVAMICVVDQRGRFLYVNPTFCHNLGYSEEELLHQRYETFVHPQDVASTRDAEASLQASGTVTTFENRYRHKDGGYRWLSWASTMNARYAYAVALDVTQQKETERRLAEVLAQNQQILRAMFDGYLLGNLDGGILDVNQNYCNMMGYTRDELLQKTVFELDVSFTDAQISEHADEIVTNDVFMVVETQHQRKDGRVIDVEINSIRQDDGRIACFIRDITDRKRLELELRHSEQLYRGLIESQIDFVCRYTPETILTYVNDAYCRFFRRSREEIVGSSFKSLAPEEELKEIFARIEEVKRNPAPAERIFFAYDDEGSKQWIQWIDYGITDETGEVVAIQAVGRDITALINAQQRLAEREEMLSTIFKNIPVMLVQIDAEGNYEYVNDHWVEVLGWTAEEMQSHPDIMAEFYPDSEQRALARQTIQHAPSGWFDGRVHTRDGSIVDTSWANVRLSDGRTLGIGQVITHRVELENQRIYARQLELELEKERELREMKERFVSLVSHEFRTPLSVMSTSLDLVMQYGDRLTPERVEEKLAVIHEQIKRMVSLMEDTLRFSKSSAGKTPFVPQSIPIASFCEKIIETIRLTDNDAHRFVLHNEAEQVMADPQLLDHILTNMLSNAAKYSPPQTTITLAVTRLPGASQFSVGDEGIGIPPEDLDRLFEPFHRGENARDFPGTGLGLSIVKDYVDIHRGRIFVESERGKGTTFRVVLPEGSK